MQQERDGGNRQKKKRKQVQDLMCKLLCILKGPWAESGAEEWAGSGISDLASGADTVSTDLFTFCLYTRARRCAMKLKDKALKSQERTHTERKTRLLLRAWAVLETSLMACWCKTQLFGVYPHTAPVIMPQMKRSPNACSCILVSSVVVCSGSWTGDCLSWCG